MSERGRNILPVIGFILIISLLLGGFAMARIYPGNNQSGGNSGVVKPKSNRSLEETGKTSTQGAKNIIINAVSSEINISRHDSDMVEAHFYGDAETSNTDALPWLEVGNDGNTAYARIKYPVGVNAAIVKQTRLDVLIPEKWSGDLEIGNVSGSISAQSLTGDNVRLNTTSGLVEVEKVEGKDVYLNSTSGGFKIDEIIAENSIQKRTVSGKCEIDTLICNEADLGSTSGETVIKSIISDKVISNSVSGSFKASVEKGAVEIGTTSAEIDVQFLDSFEMFKASSISGTISLQIPEDSEFEVYIKTISGSMDCRDFPMNVISSKENELKGTVGDGKSRIEISTASGSVEVKKND